MPKIRQPDCKGPIWNLPGFLVQESWVNFYKKGKIWKEKSDIYVEKIITDFLAYSSNS